MKSGKKIDIVRPLVEIILQIFDNIPLFNDFLSYSVENELFDAVFPIFFVHCIRNRQFHFN
jgi:hypothetical protein